jgi:alkylation response protein AidB-like acyl-CoA dehydrogenase
VAAGWPRAHSSERSDIREAAATVAAHQMMAMAARRKAAGGQSDVEAGMVKYLAAEYRKEIVEDSLRIRGGYGYSTEHEIERLYREA